MGPSSFCRASVTEAWGTQVWGGGDLWVNLPAGLKRPLLALGMGSLVFCSFPDGLG